MSTAQPQPPPGSSPPPLRPPVLRRPVGGELVRAGLVPPQGARAADLGSRLGYWLGTHFWRPTRNNVVAGQPVPVAQPQPPAPAGNAPTQPLRIVVPAPANRPAPTKTIPHPLTPGLSPLRVVRAAHQQIQRMPDISADGGIGGINRHIVVAVVVIGGVGAARALVAHQPVTPVAVGAVILLIILSLVDLFGGVLSTIASALAMLAMVVILFRDLPDLLTALRNLPTTSSKGA